MTPPAVCVPPVTIDETERPAIPPPAAPSPVQPPPPPPPAVTRSVVALGRRMAERPPPELPRLLYAWPDP